MEVRQTEPIEARELDPPRAGSPRRPRRPFASSVLLVLLAFCLSSLPLVLAASDPTAKHTLFPNLPAKLVYFEDTPIILSHDASTRNVWRSSDEGATWSQIKGVPDGEAWILVEHAWDSKVAFVLGRGKTHWRTLNSGESWQSWETEETPAITTPPLSFHSVHWDWILFTGQRCESLGGWRGKICYDETWVTQDAFSKPPKKLLDHTSKCIWAHSTKKFVSTAPDPLVFCIAYDTIASSAASSSSIGTTLKSAFGDWLAQAKSVRDSRLYSSNDFFVKDKKVVDLGVGTRDSRGLVGMGAVQKYIVAAVKPTNIFAEPGQSGDGSDEMLLFVTEDGSTWSRAKFPHGSGLKENAYTIVESTPHSIVVDVLTDPMASSGTLFTSNSNGTYFVKSLDHTNRNVMGIVDYEKIVALEGIAVANVISNIEEVEGNIEEKKVQTKMTFDDAGTWDLLRAPETDHNGKKITTCDVSDVQACSLHLHSVTQPHNFGRVFSSKAPGFLMGVGSIGPFLKDYEDCDTFLSVDGGLNWKMVDDGAHKYEFGDQGGILVMIDDEEATDEIKYSFDFGKTWKEWKMDVKVRAKLLTGVPDATSQKFLLLGTLGKKEKGGSEDEGRQVVVQLDFKEMGRRKCGEADFEKWYARKIKGQEDCLMGHKQWFHRRKPDVDCVVGEKFKEPDSQEENCPCSDEDYECDYNYAPEKGVCTLVGPEAIPPGECKDPEGTFVGSSGYRLIPGNTCDQSRGIKKDAPKTKPCSEGQATPGQITHQRHKFDGVVMDQAYFGGDSHTIVAFTTNNEVWQSSNEGFSWQEPVPKGKFISMQMHPYSRDRAYLIGANRDIHYTTDAGITWYKLTTPLEPNLLGIPILDFHPTRSDYLIWTGSKNCRDSTSSDCHAIAYYTKDNGRKWHEIDSYVRVCSWARDDKFKIPESIIFCESYRDKKGSQLGMDDNPVQLISGDNFYASKTKLFDSIVGFATFEEYMVVAQASSGGSSLDLFVSIDGKTFATGKFPPNLKIQNQAYTVLESSTKAVFLHVTTHGQPGSEWGGLFKSNSNGTYYALSLDHVNRNSKGYVDFEKMQGLDGIAVMNVVSNPDEAQITGQKKLVTRITHNDGGRWKPVPPPSKDSLGQAFDCSHTGCSLQIHGYTERSDPRATYSSPTAVGLMMAVGNVGVSLAPYVDSDTFLTRDGGLTWEEVSKDAHMWEYGDQGSILLLVNDEGPTDRVKYSLNEGLSWNEYSFGEPMRVRSIVTVPEDTSRKFILFGQTSSGGENTVAVHLDFSKITVTKCVFDSTDPNNDDFELWSPSESREEQCLFGRQVQYYRRVREPKRLCYIGEKLPDSKRQRNCACSEEDFECEFNYRRDPSTHKCVLIDGAQPLAVDEGKGQCARNQNFWFDRTEYRKIPYSSCEGGQQLDQGARHTCPSAGGHGFIWWGTVVVAPVILAGLLGFWWMRRRGTGPFRRGAIALPEPNGTMNGRGEGKGDLLDTLASVPWFVVGVSTALWGYVTNMPIVTRWFGGGSRQGYRQVSLDDDAELLQDYED